MPDNMRTTLRLLAACYAAEDFISEGENPYWPGVKDEILEMIRSACNMAEESLPSSKAIVERIIS